MTARVDWQWTSQITGQPSAPPAPLPHLSSSSSTAVRRTMASLSWDGRVWERGDEWHGQGPPLVLQASAPLCSATLLRQGGSPGPQ